ncbi:PREDICTED: protein FAM83F-like [Cyprinodon variegatus]|uniref:Family with sequence similarity 83 member E n=1 Tax=Cyprinodon variegatus TaxID=28743 RepID=A0A3Q2GI06_CYPVA|nr:PREDICTED: protein FAM83F-like [Cyprinodon variegatus]
MSDFQEKSLNENVVFQPLDETCPQFLYSEREREAVERLLSGGPEAFYSSIGPELSSCFLSPEEVSQMSSSVQSYRSNEPQVKDQHGFETSFDSENFCSTYDPTMPDMPVPNLELGWPQKPTWVLNNSVKVYSSSPAEGQLQVREVIRQILQTARTVIAIVTDQLTDNTIIFDLHTAASRGVPVYIILNQRSLQGNFTLNRLRHPNIKTRILGGKTFCSRTGRMVVGDVKSNFILVDLETVIHGSYSLTWSDVHLHRQLITVLRGQIIDSFDQEFRILFAESLPVPDTWIVPAATHACMPHQATDSSQLQLLKDLSAESELSNPPSPPPDVLLDWEAMGVVHKDSGHSASLLNEQNGNIAEKMLHLEINEAKPAKERLPCNEHLEERKSNAQVTSEPTRLPVSDGIKRPEHTKERSISRERSLEKQPNQHERAVTRIDVPPDPINSYPYKRRTPTRMESFSEEDKNTDNHSSSTNTDSTREKKPLIVRVPHNGNFSSLSDIMRRLKRGTPGVHKRGMNSTMSDQTQSMWDLSTQSDREVPVPRFLTGFNPEHMTPALVLMRKRNDELKSSINRPSAKFTPAERPRSSTLNSSIYLRNLSNSKESTL